MPTDQDQIGDSAGELTESEKRIAKERTALGAAVIHEAIRTEGDAELLRPVSALIWSGMAAGLSMGFSLAAMGLLYSRLPDTQWRPLITDFGYTFGFLAVILGRQHLYTENTLTVMLPLLTNRDRKTLWAMLRLWSVVLIANAIGAGMIAWAIARTDVFSPEVRTALTEIPMLTVKGRWPTVKRMRGEDEWRRVKKREELRRLRAAVSNRPAEERMSFRQAIRPHLSMLRRLARFEIDHLRARGQLMSDYLIGGRLHR